MQNINYIFYEVYATSIVWSVLPHWISFDVIGTNSDFGLTMFPGFVPAMSTSYLMEQYPNLSYLRDNSELQLLSRRTQTPLNLERIN